MLDINKTGTITYRFWQRGGGYDRNMIHSEIIRASIEYLHLNPVRKHLVERPEDWPWSSAGFYTGKDTYPIRMDVETLPYNMPIR